MQHNDHIVPCAHMLITAFRPHIFNVSPGKGGGEKKKIKKKEKEKENSKGRTEHPIYLLAILRPCKQIESVMASK